MNAAIAHARGLWGPWWLAPAAIVVCLCSTLFAIGDLRGEHVLLSAIVLVLAYAGPRAKRLLVALLPLVLTGAAYDLVRYARPIFVRPDRVLGCQLRAAELALFRAGPDTTLPDLFQRWHAPMLDVFFAVPYAAYIYVAAATGLYLYCADRPRMQHYSWAFAAANFLSFFVWLALPAAPPWYLRAHGCVIDASVAPSPAGLARVDALLGIHYFGAFYARAASVFGAMPSMHCAYPMIGLLTAWPHAGWRARGVHVLYALWMASAAVYLDHHWVLDALAGWTVAALAVAATSTIAGVAKEGRRSSGARTPRIPGASAATSRAA